MSRTPRIKLRLVRLALATLPLLLAVGRAAAQQPARVHPGDRLSVRILGGERPMSETLIVSEHGTVVLPWIGVTPVTHIDIAALPDSLRVQLARFVRTPAVEVTVLRRVIVNGEVNKPDVYYIDAATLLPDVIAVAGGFSERANPKKLVRIRDGVSVRLGDWTSRATADAQLNSGDQLIVPRRAWLSENFVSVVTSTAVVVSIWAGVRK